MRQLPRMMCLWLGAALVSCGGGGNVFYICDACGSADGSKASCSTFDAANAATARTACEQFFGGKICSCRPGVAFSADACGVCTGEGGGDASDWSCPWHIDSPSRAPHAGYDCVNGIIYRCQLGSWEAVVDCGTTQDDSGNACSCVGGVNYNDTSCMSAISVCAGQGYATCGPNATPVVVGGSWSCQ
jgi:hypothetical protein